MVAPRLLPPVTFRRAHSWLSRGKTLPDQHVCGAFGGIRTPNLLIRSQMLYPLSYERV